MNNENASVVCSIGNPARSSVMIEEIFDSTEDMMLNSIPTVRSNASSSTLPADASRNDGAVGGTVNCEGHDDATSLSAVVSTTASSDYKKDRKGDRKTDRKVERKNEPKSERKGERKAERKTGGDND